MLDFAITNPFSNFYEYIGKISYSKAHDESMSNSLYKAVDFDAYKESYCKKYGHSANDICSNDALIILPANRFLFVEFKNGDISKEHVQLRRKQSESLLIFNDVIKENLTFDRSNVEYILVYNELRNPNLKNANNSIKNHLSRRAGKNRIPPAFLYLKLYFSKTNLLTERQFENLILKICDGTY